MADAKTKAAPAPARRAPPIRRSSRSGRRAVQSVAALIRPAPLPGLQPKLKVGAAIDPAEAEADRIADQVLAGPAPALAAPADPAPPAQPLRRSPMDQPSTDALNETPTVSDVQQDVEVPKDEDVKTEAIDDDALKEIESGTPKNIGGEVAPMRAANPVVGPEGGEAPTSVAARIEAPGPGRPLSAAVRADLEPCFGADFRDVRIHDKPEDRAIAEAIGARAFAYKSDIWLGQGERAEDRRLMAHELTHVLQQTGRHRSPLTARGDAQPQRQTVHRFLGDAILAKIEKYARHIPGYTFISYLLGKSPITGKPVQKTAENLIYALLGLIPFGTLLADRLKETKALQKAYDWVTGRLKSLNLNWTRVKAAIAKAKDLFSIWSPIDSIKPAFAPLIRDIVVFCLEVKGKIQEFIIQGALALAGPFATKVWGVLKKAGQTISLILEDPLAFAKNLFKAIGKGFGLFFDNFGKHLKKGLLGFIFGALDGIDLKLPDKMDLKGIVSIVFQILGLTWERIRKMLVKRLKPNGEKKVAFLEKAVDILKILVTKGILGIWQKMLSMIDNLTSTVIGGITEFLFTSVLKGAISWLAGLTNPVGAIIKVVLTIYNFVVMLIERIKQILDLVNSIFGSIAEIAKGNVQSAALKVEEAIGRTIPLILAFLAAIIPVSGITTKIQKIIKKLRQPVDKAIDKLIQFLVKKAKKVLAKVIGKVNAKRKLPGFAFKVGKKTHQLYAKQKGRKKVEIYVKSEEMTTDATSKYLKSVGVDFKKGGEGEELKDVLAFIQAFDTETDDVEKKGDKVDLASKTASQGKTVEQLKKELGEAKGKLNNFGLNLANDPHVDTSDAKQILRYKADVTTFEGTSDTYVALNKKKKEFKKKNPKNPRDLQLDHNPNRTSLNTIQEKLRAAPKNIGKIFFEPVKDGKKVEQDETVFGRLSRYSAANAQADFPAIAIHGSINNAMAKIDAEQGKEVGDYIDKNGLDNIVGLKSLVALNMKEKAEKTRELYGPNIKAMTGADEAKQVFGANIEKGLKNVQSLARKELRLPSGRGSEKKATDLPSDLVRTAAVQTKSEGADFVTDEASAGNYSSLSGKKTAVGLLEADHSPMDTDMETAGTWKLGNVLNDPAGDIAAAKADPAVTALKGEAKAQAEARIDAAIRNAPLNAGKPFNTYTKPKGGAVVVGYNVNQHPEMKKPTPNLLANAKSKAAGGFDGGKKAALAQKAAKGGDTNEIGAEAMKAVNAKLRPMFREMIATRQQMAYNIYGQVELPKVKVANKGDKEKPAVGLIARIAARVKSPDTVNTLSSYTDRWFPT